MLLDEVKMCYEEYPPVPVMQCAGHSRGFRWARVLSGLATLVALGLSLIIYAYAN